MHAPRHQHLRCLHYYLVMLIFAYHNRFFFKIMIVLFELANTGIIAISGNGKNHF